MENWKSANPLQEKKINQIGKISIITATSTLSSFNQSFIA